MVNVAPCKVNGELIGEWVAGRAEIIADAIEVKRIAGCFGRKHGLQKRFFDLLGWFTRAEMTMVAVRL